MDRDGFRDVDRDIVKGIDRDSDRKFWVWD
jgi:hypothetical protein